MSLDRDQSSGLSVIIRARDEERWIGHSIQSVLDFVSFPEIIIINNGSSDRTVEIAKHFQADPELVTNRAYTDIKILDIDEYTPGSAINLGASEASNDFIMVLSSHCVLKKFSFCSKGLPLGTGPFPESANGAPQNWALRRSFAL